MLFQNSGGSLSKPPAFLGFVLRRLVGRVLAQTFSTQLQQACQPFQFGLSARAGTEALARVLRVATKVDPRATVLSVDAAGAFDHVSWAAMLAALHAQPTLQPLLPYSRQFYATAIAATCGRTTEDAATRSAKLRAASKGTSSCPGCIPWPRTVRCKLSNHSSGMAKLFFAFLDDIYVVAAPERVLQLYEHVEVALWEHARVRLNRSKTKAWNAAGEELQGIRNLQPEGGDPVWVGDCPRISRVLSR